MNQIRVIAPSDSWKTHREDAYERGRVRLENAGYDITYAEHVKSVVCLGTASAEERAADFNSAFADTDVKAIIALHGGFASNAILPFIDWDIIKANPKPLVGYSDITVLVNAIYAKTGITAYLGPNLGTIGHESLWEYTLQSLLSALDGKQYSLTPSPNYIDDKSEHKSKPWQIIHEGVARGRLLGGNIQSLFLLQGTLYQPDFEQDYILAIEDDSLTKQYTLNGFSRNLDSILQLPNARKNLKGILIGRFEAASQVSDSDLLTVMNSKHLGDIPIVTNLDFGHTSPAATLPIGAMVSLCAKDGAIDIILNTD